MNETLNPKHSTPATPVTPATPAPPAAAPRAERVRGADGKPYWKLTCFCKKVLLAPADTARVQGRCPKCGKDLLFPTERQITTGPLPVIPANKPQRLRKQKRPLVRKPAPDKNSARDRDSSKDRINPGHSASDNAADKLRPKSVRMHRASTGLVTAWPAAERGPRLLAGFIDVTIVIALLAGLLMATPYLPARFTSGTFRVAFTILMLWLNEGVLQWHWGGSVGKKLCHIILRERGGESLQPENALLRPFVKWVLFPTWVMLLLNPANGALHDRVLNIVALKGRVNK